MAIVSWVRDINQPYWLWKKLWGEEHHQQFDNHPIDTVFSFSPKNSKEWFKTRTSGYIHAWSNGKVISKLDCVRQNCLELCFIANSIILHWWLNFCLVCLAQWQNAPSPKSLSGNIAFRVKPCSYNWFEHFIHTFFVFCGWPSALLSRIHEIEVWCWCIWLHFLLARPLGLKILILFLSHYKQMCFGYFQIINGYPCALEKLYMVRILTNLMWEQSLCHGGSWCQV